MKKENNENQGKKGEKEEENNGNVEKKEEKKKKKNKGKKEKKKEPVSSCSSSKETLSRNTTIDLELMKQKFPIEEEPTLKDWVKCFESEYPRLGDVWDIGSNDLVVVRNALQVPLRVLTKLRNKESLENLPPDNSQVRRTSHGSSSKGFNPTGSTGAVDKSASTDWFFKLTDFLDALSKANAQVFLGDLSNRVSPVRHASDLRGNFENLTPEKLVEYLRIKEECFEKLKPKSIIPQAQEHCSEGDLQNLLNSNEDSLAGWDTSLKQTTQWLQGDVEGGRRFMCTGKPDFMGRSFGIFMELKQATRNELVLQILERVSVNLRMNHTCTRSIGFGVLIKKPQLEFLCVVGQQKRERGNRQVKFEIWSVQYQYFEKFWLLCNQSYCCPFQFEGLSVCKAIELVSDVEWLSYFVRVRFLRESVHPVYELILPSHSKCLYMEDSSSKKHGLNPRVAMKLFNDKDSYARESDGLTAVKPSYYLGSCWVSNGDLEGCFWSNDLVEMIGTAKKLVESSAAFKNHQKRPLHSDFPRKSFGVIFMKVGERVSGVPMARLYENAVESLKKIHKKGFLHCDPRLANILLFPREKNKDEDEDEDEDEEERREVSLIDFDLARPSSNCEILIKKESNGRRAVFPKRIRDELEKMGDGAEKKFSWSKEDDIDMLRNSIMGSSRIES